MSLTLDIWHSTWACGKEVTFQKYLTFSYFYCTGCKTEIDLSMVSFSDHGMALIGWTKKPHPQGGHYFQHDSWTDRDPYPVWIKKEDATSITAIMVKQKKKFLEAARLHFFGKDSEA